MTTTAQLKRRQLRDRVPEQIALRVEPVEPAHVLRGVGAVQDYGGHA